MSAVATHGHDDHIGSHPRPPRLNLSRSPDRVTSAVSDEEPVKLLASRPLPEAHHDVRAATGATPGACSTRSTPRQRRRHGSRSAPVGVPARTATHARRNVAAVGRAVRRRGLRARALGLIALLAACSSEPADSGPTSSAPAPAPSTSTTTTTTALEHHDHHHDHQQRPDHPPHDLHDRHVELDERAHHRAGAVASCPRAPAAHRVRPLRARTGVGGRGGPHRAAGRARDHRPRHARGQDRQRSGRPTAVEPRRRRPRVRGERRGCHPVHRGVPHERARSDRAGALGPDERSRRARRPQSPGAGVVGRERRRHHQGPRRPPVRVAREPVGAGERLLLAQRHRARRRTT